MAISKSFLSIVPLELTSETHRKRRLISSVRRNYIGRVVDSHTTTARVVLSRKTGRRDEKRDFHCWPSVALDTVSAKKTDTTLGRMLGDERTRALREKNNFRLFTIDSGIPSNRYFHSLYFERFYPGKVNVHVNRCIGIVPRKSFVTVTTNSGRRKTRS